MTAPRTRPHIVAIDASITGTALCATDTECVDVVLQKDVAGYWRHAIILESVLAVCGSADLVVIEGYSYGTRNPSIFKLAELGGVLRTGLTVAGVRWCEVAPSSIKKYATGKGNANKTDMLVQGVQRSGIAFANDNACDAWWLRALAMHHYWLPVAQVPTAHHVAVEKVDWPQLDSHLYHQTRPGPALDAS